MDSRTLFKSISKRMEADFEASTQITHAPSKGSVRESVLRDFLASGRLPMKYGLGSGEIVGRVRDTSGQCDLIVFDRFNGLTLLNTESVQVYPIDCVYGIVEVKSALPKTELIDALEKIKKFKIMSPTGPVTSKLAGGWSLRQPRPRPFGMVFAYGLAKNSLESLLQNLQEWERQNSPDVWPNYICVLGVGCLYHQKGVFESQFDSSSITAEVCPTSFPWADESLYRFFAALHDVCAGMALGPVELDKYYDPGFRIGRHIVYGYAEFGLSKDGGPARQARFSEKFIEKVIIWCDAQGPMTYAESFVRRFGSVPDAMKDLPSMAGQIFIYNPDNLPGLHEIDGPPFKLTPEGPRSVPSLMSAVELLIDGKVYIIAISAPQDEDFEFLE